MIGCGNEMSGFITSRSPQISGLGRVGDVSTGDQYTWDDYPMQQATADAAAGVDVSAPWYQDLLQFGTQAMQAYTQFRSQDALMELNVERARRGLPPIDPTAYGPAVGVGLDARTRELLQYALIGGAVLIVLPMILKRR